MDSLIPLAFLVVSVITVLAPIYIFKRKGRKVIKTILASVLMAALPLTWYMTSVYKVEWSENAYGFGWPVPRVIFARSAPGEPWLDYIGPTIILAYPMNYILFIFLPVSGLAVFTLFSDKEPKNSLKRRGGA